MIFAIISSMKCFAFIKPFIIITYSPDSQLDSQLDSQGDETIENNGRNCRPRTPSIGKLRAETMRVVSLITLMIDR